MKKSRYLTYTAIPIGRYPLENEQIKLGKSFLSTYLGVKRHLVPIPATNFSNRWDFLKILFGNGF